jgi:hypothetical protein
MDQTAKPPGFALSPGDKQAQRNSGLEAKVSLADELRDVGKAKEAARVESHTNVLGVVELSYEVECVADTSSHCVQFRIGQFTEFVTHETTPC